MTDDTPSADGGGVATPARAANTSRRTRRRFLGLLGSGSGVLLAGCGQRATGPSTGNATGESDGQTPTATDRTLRIPIQSNDPSKTSFYKLAPESAFATVVKEKPAYRFGRFIWEPGAWPSGLLATGDVQYTWIDRIEKTPTEVTVSIGDDARWSDGHPITGTDIAVPVLDTHLSRWFRPYYASDTKREPSFIFGAFDGFDIGEKSVAYQSSDAHFEHFWESAAGIWLGTWSFSLVPTHIEPYAAYANALVETARRTVRGEVNPWESRPWENDAAPTSEALKKEHLDDRKYVLKFSKPENVRAAGAWDLVELRGSEVFVFRKNPYHRNADAINYERVEFEYTPSTRREQAAIAADRLDYGSGVTPQSTVESFPDSITQLLVPGGWNTGNEIGLNFNHSALATHEVRQAIMYALDQPEIANNVHQSAAVPVTTPGGDCWDVADFVSSEWIDETLTTYTTDRTVASELMREAGYSKDGGRWVDSSGEVLTLTLATRNETPRWEPTVASQLREFGIQVSVTRLSESQFSSRVEAGEFPMWAAGGTSTSHAAATFLLWMEAPQYPKQYGIYPDEQLDTGRFSPEGVPIPKTEERWRVFTITAPPIGQPNGHLTEYHPSALSLMYFTNPPEPEFRRRVEIGLWLANRFLPTIPINKTVTQRFIDDTNWQWPTHTTSWKNFTGGGPRGIMGLLASGTVHAIPNDPDEA